MVLLTYRDLDKCTFVQIGDFFILFRREIRLGTMGSAQQRGIEQSRLKLETIVSRLPSSIAIIRNAVLGKDKDGDCAMFSVEATALKSQLLRNGANRFCETVAEVSTSVPNFPVGYTGCLQGHGSFWSGVP